MIFEILLNIITPIFIIIGIGWFLAKKVTLDVASLSRLNFYVFVPALIFVKLAIVDFEWSFVGKILIFSLIITFLLMLISLLIFRVKLFYEHRKIMTMCTIFFNAGNYGIPLVLLAFGENSIPIITIVLMLQNLLTFSLGIVLIRSGKVKFSEIIKSFLKVPVLYAVIGGVLLRLLKIDLESVQFIYEPLNYLGAGLIPIALLTLGSQMSSCKLDKKLLYQIGFTNFFKLIISPVLGYIIATLMGFDSYLRDVLVVISGLPSAVNVFILAVEYKQDEDLSSQVVFSSTLLSGFTLCFIITVLKVLS